LLLLPDPRLLRLLRERLLEQMGQLQLLGLEGAPRFSRFSRLLWCRGLHHRLR
jgi:hypothetical protein